MTSTTHFTSRRRMLALAGSLIATLTATAAAHAQSMTSEWVLLNRSAPAVAWPAREFAEYAERALLERVAPARPRHEGGE